MPIQLSRVTGMPGVQDDTTVVVKMMHANRMTEKDRYEASRPNDTHAGAVASTPGKLLRHSRIQIDV